MPGTAIEGGDKRPVYREWSTVRAAMSRFTLAPLARTRASVPRVGSLFQPVNT